MPNISTFLAWAESVVSLNYYDILRVKPASSESEVKAAFHSFALRAHPDRYVDDDPQVAAAAAEVFKRGVEAYTVLVRPDLRARYDRAIARGKLRLDPDLPESAPPPPPRQKTIEELCTTPRGKTYAVKADRLVSINKLDEARVQLVNAIQSEPFNEDLRSRLDALYQMMGTDL